MRNFSYQIYSSTMEPTISGNIEAVDMWDAIQKLSHLKPADFTIGNMPWCKLSDVPNKVIHHVFIDGSTNDQPINVTFKK